MTHVDASLAVFCPAGNTEAIETRSTATDAATIVTARAESDDDAAGGSDRQPHLSVGEAPDPRRACDERQEDHRERGDDVVRIIGEGETRGLSRLGRHRKRNAKAMTAAAAVFAASRVRGSVRSGERGRRPSARRLAMCSSSWSSAFRISPEASSRPNVAWTPVFAQPSSPSSSSRATVAARRSP